MKSGQTYPLNTRQDSVNVEIGINRDPIDTTISIENTKCFLFTHGSVLLDSVHEGRPQVNNRSVSLKDPCSLQLMLMETSPLVQMIAISCDIHLKKLFSSFIKPKQDLSVQFSDRMNHLKYSQKTPIDRNNSKATFLVSILYRSLDNQWFILSVQRWIVKEDVTSSQIVKEFQNLFVEYKIPGFEFNSASQELKRGNSYELNKNIDKNVTIAASWNSNVNVDLTVGLYDENQFEVHNLPIFHANRELFDGSIQYTDVNDFNKETYHQGYYKSNVNIQLDKIPSTIYYLAVVLVVKDEDKYFNDVLEPTITLLNSDTHLPICRYKLEDDETIQQNKKTARLMVYLGKYGDESWLFTASGRIANGRNGIDALQSLSEWAQVKNIEKEKNVQIEITVSEARDLLSFDLNGYSDPYFKIFIDNKLVFVSDVVYKCLNPKWKKNNYENIIYIKPMIGALAATATAAFQHSLLYNVRIEVWDSDTFSQDDFMGQVVLDIDLEKANGKYEELKWYELKDKKSQLQGYIQIDAKFKLISKENSLKKRKLEFY
jgi:stress response protein SCP2